MCIAVASAVVGCSGPETIPDKELESIITDVLLTEGVINSGLKLNTVTVPIDSIDFYSPILNQYGFTIIDFRYTINQLASRKSNPLEGIMANVMTTIDKQAAIAQLRYDAARRYDSIALSAYADTIYAKDTTIVGSLKKFRIKLDSIAVGDYRITLNYRSMLDYRLPQKSIRYYFNQKGGKSPVQSNIWLSRSDKVKEVDEVISTPVDRDSLIIFFTEAEAVRQTGKKDKPLKDTSQIENIVIVYTPPLNEARSRYYISMFGKDFLLFSDFKKQYEQKFKKDSLPGPLGRKW